MAVSGCDFVCQNEQCQHKGCGVVITAPWPLGDIDKVIGAKNLMKNPVFRQELGNLKKQGRKYACISMPNDDKIPAVGYRIHRWCEKCPCLWTYDAIIPEGQKADGSEESINAAMTSSNIPVNCPTCDTKLKSYVEVINENGDGILCTSCKTRLQANVWFCNESREQK